MRRGANVRAVQELMGHSNLNTTQGYVAVTSKDLRDTINLLNDKPESELPQTNKEHHCCPR